MTQLCRMAWVCGILLITAVGARAQEGPTTRGGGDAQSVAVVSEKSPVAAGVLEWAFPTLGYAYAGNWSRGVPSALVRITGLVLFMEDQFVIFGEPPPCEGQCVLGVAMALGGTIWAIVDAGRTATRENERKRASVLGATVVPTYGPAGPGIGLHVPVGW